MLILAAFTASRGHPLAAGAAVPGDAASPASSHGHRAAPEEHSQMTCSQKAQLGSSGKIPSVQLDVENMANHLPKTSSWRLC